MKYSREKKVQVLEKLIKEDFKDTMMSIHKMSEKDIEFVLDRLIERRSFIRYVNSTPDEITNAVKEVKNELGING